MSQDGMNEWMNELMGINGPFNITGHIGTSYQRGEMNDDMIKHPPEFSRDPDSNPWPLVHKASMRAWVKMEEKCLTNCIEKSWLQWKS